MLHYVIPKMPEFASKQLIKSPDRVLLDKQLSITDLRIRSAAKSKHPHSCLHLDSTQHICCTLVGTFLLGCMVCTQG